MEVGRVVLERAPARDETGRRLAFRAPVRAIEAWRPEEVRAALSAVDAALAEGLYVAGFIGYEAGLALEPKLAGLPMFPPAGEPLLWLGCYTGVECFTTEETKQASQSASQAQATSQPVLSLDAEEYAQRVEAIQALIAAGETYQANLTMEARWQTDEPASAIYARLLRAQPVAYAARLRPREDWQVLSFSPELFFRREGDRIVTKPMKGTADPGLDMAEARAQAAWLAADEKNRAENVMIVDLLRNDLGRICRMGSVAVTELFAVERYPTVLQMTSTVEGQLRDDVSYAEIFAALFPSGSIVGAPKVQTMRRLREIESRPRGVYTGAIGYIAPTGEAEFNVAIRTVILRGSEARMGVGSGIVTDSVADMEYAECHTKLAFLTREAEQDFSLIETLLLEEDSYTLLTEHLERMGGSAEYFLMPFDETRVQAALEEARLDAKGERRRVRLLLDREGHATWNSTTMPASDAGPVSVMLWPEKTHSQDRFLRHKTTRRALYDDAFKTATAAGCADALFENERGEITEGAIHNVIAVMDGRWITPPLACGVLPGVYRRRLLEERRVAEGVLRWEDLLRAEAVYLCNSVRGLRVVRLT